MAARARFEQDVVDRIRADKIIGIRAGSGPHRVIGIWAVVVENRVFVRSWSRKPDGWNRRFQDEPSGSLHLGDLELPIRAVRTRSERILAAIDAAYLAKYHTKGSIQYARDLGRPECRATTVELVPAAVSQPDPVVARPAHLVLFVKDQRKSAEFYATVLGRAPRLDVPGMTEFELGSGAVLGLMPEAGIRRLLGRKIENPASAGTAPRCELYLVVEDPAACLGRAIGAGARSLSPLGERDWGHTAGYVADPNGHVVAFASLTKKR